MGYDVLRNSNRLRASLIENGFDPDLICEFLQEQLALNRATDCVQKDILGKCEFYRRELKYTQIEQLIFKLK